MGDRSLAVRLSGGQGARPLGSGRNVGDIRTVVDGAGLPGTGLPAQGEASRQVTGGGYTRTAPEGCMAGGL
ncbi:hypothetical protein OG204_34955 [Streptomyces sp. NBC_01387]|uniref:hypothetical protein n=1 Tax=unclassified Streptomyces TaxID=2593676 RepID=UPI002025428D|nr:MULTISPECIES: hypothetical protein [unclassified Streptomyces]MCX4553212.1 hypothetical protein [Streptomyces sp. NBC_01500]WSC18186.1 hypothetical protein OIE60_00160 [Streptomyces sp. NBC_01766]WSV52231.1 hypothetical protein OG282_00210 [Streptomyces sp. NBC_01014]